MPRAIYTCQQKVCRHRWAFDYSERDEIKPRRFTRQGYYKPARVRWFRIVGTDRRYLCGIEDRSCSRCLHVADCDQVKGTAVPSCPCDWRCNGARGPVCECSCGGKNHGGALLVADAWNASAPTHTITPTASRIPAAQPRLFGI